MNLSESIVKPFEWHAGRAVLPPHIEDLFLMTTPSAEELLHELLAHQSQLEMQNDELRHMQLALEESRDRYVDLYDFAPVGYLSIDDNGMIAKANLTAAALLGQKRPELLQRRFDAFVVEESRDAWRRHFIATIHAANGQRRSIELALQTGDGALLQAHVDCLRAAPAFGYPVVRIALTDITECKQCEIELKNSEQHYRELAATLERHRKQLEETVAARTAELLATQRDAERLARLAIEVETAARAAKFNTFALADDLSDGLAEGMDKLLDEARKHLRSPTETH